MINTAEGFMETCVPSGANPFTVGNSNCGWNSSSTTAKAIILIFKEQPLEMMSYDAQSVKDYMIANELWREDGIEEKHDECTKSMMR